MNVESHAPGLPCWADLMCSDVDKAAAFYSGLFGWEVPEGNAEFGGYRSCTLNGRTVAGLMPQMDPNGPCVWGTYVCTADAEATAQAGVDAGGTTMFPVMDVGALGRMGVLVDPAGAVYGVWQPGEHKGAQVYNEHGAMCWIELTTTAVEQSAAFYSKVFGWGVHSAPGYTEFQVDGTSVAGMMAPPMPGMPNYWGVYFAVDDTDAVAAKAAELGGTVHVAPTDIQPGRFAVLADPNGAVFNVLTLNTNLA